LKIPQLKELNKIQKENKLQLKILNKILLQYLLPKPLKKKSQQKNHGTK
jgi:hypothetical protein